MSDGCQDPLQQEPFGVVRDRRYLFRNVDSLRIGVGLILAVPELFGPEGFVRSV